MQKATELFARACFQKGGIHLTEDRIGLLVFISELERQTLLTPDCGIESSIPSSIWETLRNDLQSVFLAKIPREEIIAKLEAMIPIFSRYIPQVEGDKNELPDNLIIDL
jgi:putative membrane protein